MRARVAEEGERSRKRKPREYHHQSCCLPSGRVTFTTFLCRELGSVALLGDSLSYLPFGPGGTFICSCYEPEQPSQPAAPS